MSDPDARPNAEPAARLRLVPADTAASSHWDGLRDPGNEPAFAASWLHLQCHRIAGAAAGLLLIPKLEAGTSHVTVTWPAADLHADDLLGFAERALAERRIVVGPGRVGRDASPVRPVVLIVALPLGMSNEGVAAAAIALTTEAGRPAATPKTVADQLRWGAGWLEALPWTRHARDLSDQSARSASCLDLLATAGSRRGLRQTAFSLVNELASRLRCDRVSIGVVARNGMIRLRAVSHSADFRQATRVVDAIENAMDEAIAQGRSVAHPPLPAMERAVTIAHGALAGDARAPGASTLSVVLSGGRGKAIGAITFERHRTEPFRDDELHLAEAAGALLGPYVDLQSRQDRFVAGRLVDGLADGCRALLGPRRPALKLATAGAMALIAVSIFAKGEHRVTAKAVLEGELQRAAAAPFDGYVRDAPVRAGDPVRRGDLLAALDDRDLALDRLKWRAERDKLRQRHREALAKHDRSAVAVLDPQIRQAEIQLALAEEKLSRARILAPFDGIVVSGDLSQALGSPVEKGKTLFEISPLDSYRLIVQVDERDTRYVAVGQGGTVAFTGQPDAPMNVRLSKITPVTVSEDGRNGFRVEARLSEPAPGLRPGMEGVAKIAVGERTILWIWMHPVVDWLRLVAWKYLP